MAYAVVGFAYLPTLILVFTLFVAGAFVGSSLKGVSNG